MLVVLAYLIVIVPLALVFREWWWYFQINAWERRRQSSLIILSYYLRQKTRNIARRGRILDDDSKNAFLGWYEQHDPKQTLDVILHSSGGCVAVSDTVLRCLLAHKGQVNIFVPRYAWSAGTMTALCGHNLYMNPFATLSPVDPLMTVDLNKEEENVHTYAYVDLATLIERKKKQSQVDDTLLIAEIELKKVYDDTLRIVREILAKRHPYLHSKEADQIVQHLASAKTHHHETNFSVSFLQSLGLRVLDPVPKLLQRIFVSCF